MHDSPIPRWSFLSTELGPLAAAVRSVAVRSGCRPEVVLDAVAEALAAEHRVASREVLRTSRDVKGLWAGEGAVSPAPGTVVARRVGLAVVGGGAGGGAEAPPPASATPAPRRPA